jgi:hypothetical protein
MRRTALVGISTFLSFFLSGCILMPVSTDTHLECGMGSAPIPEYRTCMERQYRDRSFGSLDSDEMRILLAADEAASLVATGKLTRAQGYSYIAQVRSDVNNRIAAQKRAAWADAMDQQQQQQNQIFNNLLNSQNNGLTSDYWQVHQNGTTKQCRRFGNQVSCQ